MDKFAEELPYIDTIKEMLGVDRIYFIDFETYFQSIPRAKNNFSLKNKTMPEYILDDRFHVTATGVVVDDAPDVECVSPADDPEFLPDLISEIREAKEEGLKVAVCCHNTSFDGAILNWCYGLTFDMYLDTQMMRRLLYSNRPGNLKSCAIDEWPDDPEYRKGGDELEAVNGLTLPYIDDDKREALCEYGKQDVALMRALFVRYFCRMCAHNVEKEVDLIHITIRAAVEPQFIVNTAPLLERIDIETEKRRVAEKDMQQLLLDKFNIDDVNMKTLASNKQYAELLEQLSLKVPTKISKTTKKEAPALAKNDPDYVKLRIKHKDLAPLFVARELASSNNAVTRAKRFIDYKKRFDERAANTDGKNMPFFLTYYGAKQTGRWSGTEKVNHQNLTADRLGNGSDGHHRISLTAPEGRMIDVCDLSNIELRINMWLCGETFYLDKFAEDEEYDYYSEVATPIFKFEVNKKEHKKERQMGKAAGLGLGFAMGWPGFQNYLASGPMGMQPMFETDDFCREVKTTYDKNHPHIVKMWEFINKVVIKTIVDGGEVAFGPNDSVIARKDQIQLPSGRILKYENARWHGYENRNGYVIKGIFDSDKYGANGRPTPKTMWHGLILENMVQAIARDVLGPQMINVEKYLQDSQLGHVIGSVHDEILSDILAKRADEIHESISHIMSTAPSWAQGLPLACEGGYDTCYSK